LTLQILLYLILRLRVDDRRMKAVVDLPAQPSDIDRVRQDPVEMAPGGSSDRKSFSPRLIVLRATPVDRATTLTPPYPAARASAAANNRRPRSSKLARINTQSELPFG